MFKVRYKDKLDGWAEKMFYTEEGAMFYAKQCFTCGDEMVGVLHLVNGEWRVKVYFKRVKRRK